MLILMHKGYKFTSILSGAGDLPATASIILRDSLQLHITKLSRDAGIIGNSSHCGRRTMASRLSAQGHAVETIQQPLGQAELDHVRPYLQVLQKKLEEMFTDLLLLGRQ